MLPLTEVRDIIKVKVPAEWENIKTEETKDNRNVLILLKTF